MPLATSLLDAGASPKANLNGDTLLMLAAGANCLEGVDLLVGKGADVNGAGEDGETPLMRAAGEGYTDMVALLLKRGADIEIQNKSNQSAWFFAAMGNRTEIVDLLRAVRDAHEQSKPDTPR